MLKEVVVSLDNADDLFPCKGEEGQEVYPSPEAILRARLELGVGPEAELTWHLPDVFSIRYGSNYIGTASCGENKVRFVSDEGTFKEGDDQ